ncbi:hypothetical protein B0H19DRAFT_1247171 [Mycena capillaripes]|nr:hypothetical protein B0H19DRAFT_1247171 [Mycena capillaripes]
MAEAAVIALTALTLVPPLMEAVSHKVSPARRFDFWQERTFTLLSQWDALKCTSLVPDAAMKEISDAIVEYNLNAEYYRNSHKQLNWTARRKSAVDFKHSAVKLHGQISGASERAMALKATCMSKHRDDWDEHGNCPHCARKPTQAGESQPPNPPDSTPQTGPRHGPIVEHNLSLRYTECDGMASLQGNISFNIVGASAVRPL